MVDDGQPKNNPAMLEQISPPTDNLYKFLALSGVAVVLVVLVFGVDQVVDLVNRATEYNIELAAWRAEAEWEKQHAPPTTGPAEFGGLTREAYVKAEQFKAKRKAIEDLAKFRGDLIGLGSLAAGGGLALAAWGFWLWWSRLQRLEDRLLSMDVDERVGKLTKSDASGSA